MTASPPPAPEEGTAAETLEQMQARHRKELKDLQGRITNKKKNATKKTRKFVNDECAEMERQLRERQEQEVRRLLGQDEDEAQEDGVDGVNGVDGPTPDQKQEEEISSKLSTTHLSSSQSQPQQQQQQAPKPKRNRQKERLARRQAEQLALAAAAESEAANMTDHRAVEREAMRREFDAHKLVEKEIAPDGHCLFAAVADQLVALGIDLNCPAVAAAGGGEEKDGEGEEGYKLVRKAAAGYILLHQDEYACFLAADDEVEAGGVEAYVKRIRDTAEWGGQLELAALANAYGVEIRVVQGAGRVEVIAPSGGEEEEGRKTVWLAYYRHGYGLGEHYNSLRKG